jgi:hypothetical protein
MLTPSFSTAEEHGKQVASLIKITNICKALLQKHYEHKTVRNNLQPRVLEQNRTERNYCGNRKKERKKKRGGGTEMVLTCDKEINTVNKKACTKLDPSEQKYRKSKKNFEKKNQGEISTRRQNME